MKKSKYLFATILSSFIISCGDVITTNSDSNDGSQDIGKIFFQLDLTTAPSDVEILTGILFREGFI